MLNQTIFWETILISISRIYPRQLLDWSAIVLNWSIFEACELVFLFVSCFQHWKIIKSSGASSYYWYSTHLHLMMMVMFRSPDIPSRPISPGSHFLAIQYLAFCAVFTFICTLCRLVTHPVQCAMLECASVCICNASYCSGLVHCFHSCPVSPFSAGWLAANPLPVCHIYRYAAHLYRNRKS